MNQFITMLFVTNPLLNFKLKMKNLALFSLIALLSFQSGFPGKSNIEENNETIKQKIIQGDENVEESERKRVTVEEDTEIKVVLTKSVSSRNSAVGQPIEAEVSEDVIVDDRVAIAKGTKVKGYISSIQRAKRMGRGGNISLQVSSVKAVDKQKVTLRSTMARVGSDKTGKTVAMTVIFGLPGLLVKGRDAGVRKGTVIPAYVDEDYIISSNLQPTIEVEDTSNGEVEKSSHR